MQNVTKLANDIFSMGFDIVIPVSGCIVAFVIAAILFLIRFVSFRRNKRKYERRQKRRAKQELAAAAVSVAAEPSARPQLAGDAAEPYSDPEPVGVAEPFSFAASVEPFQAEDSAQNPQVAAPVHRTRNARAARPSQEPLFAGDAWLGPDGKEKPCDALTLKLLLRAVDQAKVQREPANAPAREITDRFSDEIKSAMRGAAANAGTTS